MLTTRQDERQLPCLPGDHVPSLAHSRDLDVWMQVMEEGNLNVIASEPGTGKTSLQVFLSYLASRFHELRDMMPNHIILTNVTFKQKLPDGSFTNCFGKRSNLLPPELTYGQTHRGFPPWVWPIFTFWDGIKTMNAARLSPDPEIRNRNFFWLVDEFHNFVSSHKYDDLNRMFSRWRQIARKFHVSLSLSLPNEALLPADFRIPERHNINFRILKSKSMTRDYNCKFHKSYDPKEVAFIDATDMIPIKVDIGLPPEWSAQLDRTPVWGFAYDEFTSASMQRGGEGRWWDQEEIDEGRAWSFKLEELNEILQGVPSEEYPEVIQDFIDDKVTRYARFSAEAVAPMEAAPTREEWEERMLNVFSPLVGGTLTGKKLATAIHEIFPDLHEVRSLQNLITDRR